MNDLVAREREIAKGLRLRLFTVLNMNHEQLGGIVERKLRQTVIPALPVDFDERYDSRVPFDLSADVDPIRSNTATLRRSLSTAERERNRHRVESVLDGTVTFVNRSIDFDDPERIDWRHPEIDEYPRLWSMKIHGFVPLSWVVLGYDHFDEEPERTFQSWIRDWIEGYPIGSENYLRDAWAPYAVSTRLLHWCRFAAWADECTTPSPAFLRAIYKNALFLENHVESDVGGNHLIENGAALVVAGTLLGDRGRRWIDVGIDVLEEAAESQFLRDGGHFERSPMYHLLVLQRYLTVIDVLETLGYPYPTSIRRATRNAAQFVADMQPPDETIPLLNDSVFEQGLSMSSILRYADRVGIEVKQTDRDVFPASGYYWMGEGSNRLLVDGGAVGPAHLPAHSHNDFLQILLWIDGKRLITDTGVFHYAPDSYREDARSVRSHNTVQVGEIEPIEIGDRFLMGRRTRPQVAFGHTGNTCIFDGEYQFGLDRSYKHRRRISHRPTWWLIWDDVESATSDPVHSRLHLAPDVTARREDGAVLLTGEGVSCRIYPLRTRTISFEDGYYYPKFGEKQQRTVIDLQPNSGASAQFGFLITKRDLTDVDIEYGDGDPIALVIDGETMSRPTADDRSVSHYDTE